MSTSSKNASAYRCWCHVANGTFDNRWFRSAHSFMMHGFSCQHLQSWYMLEANIRVYTVKMMWLTTRLMIFDATASHVFGYSMIHSNVHVSTDSSICDFKFPKVMLAHISGEVGTLCPFLLSVYSRTCLPIFTEIGSYFRDTEQKNCWHFFETQFIYTFVRH